MQSERLVYLLYCKDTELGDRLEQVLSGMDIERVSSRKALLAPPMNTCAIVFGLAKCSDGDVQWLRSASEPLRPPCVVVAHLSVPCLKRLYPLRSRRLQVIWADEAESRLVDVLDELRRVSRSPMWRLGLRLLSDYSFRSSVRETIGRICGLHDNAVDTPVAPENSVGQLARQVDLAPSTLSRYWREEVPLRCNLKEFVSWAVLLWALRRRSRDGWGAIAAQAGLRRRTLERNFFRMAGCTLAAAAEDPNRVVERFNQWVHSVWDPHSSNGSRKHDPVPARAPGEQTP